MIIFHLMKKENPSLTVKDEDVDKKLKEIEKDEGKDKLEKDLKEAGISLDECKFLIKQSLYEELPRFEKRRQRYIAAEPISKLFGIRQVLGILDRTAAQIHQDPPAGLEIRRNSQMTGMDIVHRDWAQVLINARSDKSRQIRVASRSDRKKRE